MNLLRIASTARSSHCWRSSDGVIAVTSSSRCLNNASRPRFAMALSIGWGLGNGARYICGRRARVPAGLAVGLRTRMAGRRPARTRPPDGVLVGHLLRRLTPPHPWRIPSPQQSSRPRAIAPARQGGIHIAPDIGQQLAVDSATIRLQRLEDEIRALLDPPAVGELGML